MLSLAAVAKCLWLVACAGTANAVQAFDGRGTAVFELPAAGVDVHQAWRQGLAAAPVGATATALQLTRVDRSEQRRTIAATGRIERAVGADTLAAERLFRWAENRYPSLFEANRPTQSLTVEGRTYVLRFYPSSNNYLAVSDGTAYALGPLTGGQVQSYGRAADIACTVERVNCAPSLGTVPVAASPRNSCTEAAPDTLVAGAVASWSYLYSGAASGRVTITAVVDGEVAFQGWTAFKVTGTTTGKVVASNGTDIPVTARISTYQVTQPDGTVLTLGEDSERTVVEAPTCTRTQCTGGGALINRVTQTIYPQGVPDTEFRLAVGQRLSKVVPMRLTQLAPTAIAAVDSTRVETHAFEALETLTVRGRRYDTCRYRFTTSNEQQLKWFEVGTGSLVQLQTVGAAVLKAELEPQ